MNLPWKSDRKLGFIPYSEPGSRDRMFAGHMETSGLLEKTLSLPNKTKPEIAIHQELVDHSERMPRISVIVPAHNEEQYLAATLDSLNDQEYPPHEIIVVANGCNDRTTEVARHRCHRLIVLSQKCLGVARNLGARMAQGDILLFLDADTTLEPTALRKIARSFTAAYSSGTLIGQPDCDRLSFRLLYMLKNFVHRTHLHTGSSGVIICWRKDFVRVGGFDEHLQVRENSELIKRLSRYGRYKYISDVPAVTSMRRYEQKGVWPMVWLWIKVWLQSIFGDIRKKQYETVR